MDWSPQEACLYMFGEVAQRSGFSTEEGGWEGEGEGGEEEEGKREGREGRKGKER